MNTNSKISVESKPNSQVYFCVKVEADKMPLYKEQALIELGENVSIGGFRKGKAPISVIENSLDKDKLMIETMDMAVKGSYYDSVMSMKEEITTLGTPKIDLLSKPGEDLMSAGFEYSVLVDIYPNIELPDLKKIKVDKKSNEVEKKELDAAMDDILKKRSSLKEVADDYQIIQGDWMEIDFTATVEGKELSDVGSKSFPLIVGNHSLLPEFEKNLLNHKKKDVLKFELDIDTNFRDKRMAGKKVEFDVLINDVKNVVKPELNDDFVKELKIDQVDTVDKLQNFIKENLQKEKEIKIEDELRNEILDNIYKEVNFELPLTLKDREIHMMWHEFEDNLKKRGIDPADYIKRENLEVAKIKEGWMDQAEKRAKIALLIGEMIRKYQITVDKQEIADYIKQELENIKSSLSKSYPDEWKDIYKDYQKQYKSDQSKKYFEEQLLVTKVFNVLKEEVVK